MIENITPLERQARVLDLIAESHQILDDAIAEHVTGAKRSLAAVAVLYSGGNDSTVLAHMFKDRATHAIHANTGIGIEATRQFVRDTCADWNLPLIEEHPPTSYRELVMGENKGYAGGFPGPAMHWLMYQRLKERCLEQARRKLLTNPYRERVVFLAGRRRDESQRRADIGAVDRKGSMVFVSPLVSWTKLDLNTYRQMFPNVPKNLVSDLLHMSGECLCGAFAHAGELDEIGEWFPEVKAEIETLEADVLATGRVPAWKCRWGWGADKGAIEAMRKTGATDAEIAAAFTRSESGPLCSSCDFRADGGAA